MSVSPSGLAHYHDFPSFLPTTRHHAQLQRVPPSRWPLQIHAINQLVEEVAEEEEEISSWPGPSTHGRRGIKTCFILFQQQYNLFFFIFFSYNLRARGHCWRGKQNKRPREEEEAAETFFFFFFPWRVKTLSLPTYLLLLLLLFFFFGFVFFYRSGAGSFSNCETSDAMLQCRCLMQVVFSPKHKNLI